MNIQYIHVYSKKKSLISFMYFLSFLFFFPIIIYPPPHLPAVTMARSALSFLSFPAPTSVMEEM